MNKIKLFKISKKVQRGVAVTAMEKTVAMAAGRNKKNTTTAQTSQLRQRPEAGTDQWNTRRIQISSFKGIYHFGKNDS